MNVAQPPSTDQSVVRATKEVYALCSGSPGRGQGFCLWAWEVFMVASMSEQGLEHEFTCTRSRRKWRRAVYPKRQHGIVAQSATL